MSPSALSVVACVPFAITPQRVLFPSSWGDAIACVLGVDRFMDHFKGRPAAAAATAATTEAALPAVLPVTAKR